MRDKPEPVRVIKHGCRHLRHAAELARQRPFGARPIAQDAAEHLRPRRDARDLLDLGLAIDREEADAERKRARDIPLLLDRVAVADPVRPWQPVASTVLDLDDGGACRSRSRVWPAGRAPPGRGWPSRRRTRACRATPSRRHRNYRARHRGRAQGRDRRPVPRHGVRGGTPEYGRSSRHPFEGRGFTRQPVSFVERDASFGRALETRCGQSNRNPGSHARLRMRSGAAP